MTLHPARSKLYGGSILESWAQITKTGRWKWIVPSLLVPLTVLAYELLYSALAWIYHTRTALAGIYITLHTMYRIQNPVCNNIHRATQASPWLTILGAPESHVNLPTCLGALAFHIANDEWIYPADSIQCRLLSNLISTYQLVMISTLYIEEWR